MAEPIETIRLTRNLRYKLTYAKVFESYLQSATDPEVVELLRTLIETQQNAISALASYLRNLDANLHELELNEKLLAQAAGRTDPRSQLRFLYDGQQRAVEWYRMQLLDRQMNSTPELRTLLFELGEMEAAKLWRMEVVMGLLKIPSKAREAEYEAAPEAEREEAWRPRLIDDIERPSWASDRPPRWSAPSKRRRPK